MARRGDGLPGPTTPCAPLHVPLWNTPRWKVYLHAYLLDPDWRQRSTSHASIALVESGLPSWKGTAADRRMQAGCSRLARLRLHIIALPPRAGLSGAHDADIDAKHGRRPGLSPPRVAEGPMRSTSRWPDSLPSEGAAARLLRRTLACRQTSPPSLLATRNGASRLRLSDGDAHRRCQPHLCHDFPQFLVDGHQTKCGISNILFSAWDNAQEDTLW